MTNTFLFVIFLVCVCSPLAFSVFHEKDFVLITNTKGYAVQIREEPCLRAAVVTTARSGDMLVVTKGPIHACDDVWYRVVGENDGWVAERYLYKVLSPVDAFQRKLPLPVTRNKIGVSLTQYHSSVNQKNAMNAVSELVGTDGWVLLKFADITVATTAPKQEWLDALHNAYDRRLNVVVQLGHDTEEDLSTNESRLQNFLQNQRIRDDAVNTGVTPTREMSEDIEHLSYQRIAKAYAAVASQLPLPENDSQLLYITIHNAPNTCAGWKCRRPEFAALTYDKMAKEYVHFLDTVIDEIRYETQFNPKIRLSAAPLEAFGPSVCHCGQPLGLSPSEVQLKSQPKSILFQNPTLRAERIESTVFLSSMVAHKPNIFEKVDFFASRSMPSSDSLKPGSMHNYFVYEINRIYREEVKAIQRQTLPIVIVDYGYPLSADDIVHWSDEQHMESIHQIFSRLIDGDIRILGVLVRTLIADPNPGPSSLASDDVDYSLLRESNKKSPVATYLLKRRCAKIITGEPKAIAAAGCSGIYLTEKEKERYLQMPITSDDTQSDMKLLTEEDYVRSLHGQLISELPLSMLKHVLGDVIIQSKTHSFM